MIANPSDSPKGSVVLEPSDVADSVQHDANSIFQSAESEFESALASSVQAKAATEENYGLNDEDLIAAEDVDGLSYADLRHHCKIRDLPAIGKAEVLRKRLVEHLRKEEPTDEATAAEKARMLEQERQFQEEAELQRLEQERIASKKEAKRLGLEQQELLAREAEREQAARERIASNREFLARAKKRREAEEARQRDVEAKMQKRAAEAKRKAEKEAAKQHEAAEKEAAGAAVKEPASTSIRAHAAASPEVTGAPRVKQEDETNDEAASAAAGSRILAGVASGAAGVGGTLKSGAMAVLGMMSPTLSAKKEPETIELLDDSDDEAAKQQTKDVEQDRVAAKKEAKRLQLEQQELLDDLLARDAEREKYGLNVEDLIVPEDVEGLSYADLRHHCKIRDLPAIGKAEVLRKRLVEHLHKEEPTDEATAAEKARMLEQERQFQEEAELQRLEQERIASKKEAKRLGLEQQELLAREAEREQAGRERIASNREFLC